MQVNNVYDIAKNVLTDILVQTTIFKRWMITIISSVKLVSSVYFSYFHPVQSEEPLTSEQGESAKEQQHSKQQDAKSRSRHNSDEHRKRREDRERMRRIREEEEREQRERRRRERAREAEEKRRLERERREERERRRLEKQEKEAKEAEMDRLVGKGKTLPDRPSVVRLAGKSKCKFDQKRMGEELAYL